MRRAVPSQPKRTSRRSNLTNPIGGCQVFCRRSGALWRGGTGREAEGVRATRLDQRTKPRRLWIQILASPLRDPQDLSWNVCFAGCEVRWRGGASKTPRGTRADAGPRRAPLHHTTPRHATPRVSISLTKLQLRSLESWTGLTAEKQERGERSSAGIVNAHGRIPPEDEECNQTTIQICTPCLPAPMNQTT